MAEVLNVEKRENLSRSESRRLRRTGRVPGIYYIHGEESLPLSVDLKEFQSVIHSDANIVDLAFPDEKKQVKCVIREVQWDPVQSNPLHVDFLGVKLTEKVAIAIPVHLVGTSTGVKNNGGILQHVIRELNVECLPLDIPEHFEIDVTDLEVGDAIHVSDISIDKVTILNDPDQSIAIVRPPAVVVEEVEEVAEEEEVTEPEIVGEKKDEAEEAAKE